MQLDNKPSINYKALWTSLVILRSDLLLYPANKHYIHKYSST